ncbi:MAG: S-adenosylmethionine:tRNA ribosyltransferase-isomerase [Bacteroidales bacterium]|nr:S-adenosylmethionine:tRNA ribosyltransferase-isomerase [Bacteroidales bacterium]
MIPDIDIRDYDYDLPEERIAKYPLPQRDASKLLVYGNGQCRERVFRDLPEELPAGALMVFNETRVVPARLFFRRQSGAHIEIFCLQPESPADYQQAFAARGTCVWKCVVGNAKRWKEDALEPDLPETATPHTEAIRRLSLRAELAERNGETARVRFRWTEDASFSEVLELCGRIPIPPYLKRETEAIDAERYQTTYARVRGSVAAPTAGLHFTDAVLDALQKKGIGIAKLCLHVGAGTFLPVKSEKVAGHPMHAEPFSVTKAFLEKIIDNENNIIAVGTTSVRSLESLYYAGVQVLEEGRPGAVAQWAPYIRPYDATTREALEALVRYMDAQGLAELQIRTSIIIVPGFRFRLVKRMVTNFHQPQSTLLLLISAFIGKDWRRLYDFALQHGFRFLSYGDSSLLSSR